MQRRIFQLLIPLIIFVAMGLILSFLRVSTVSCLVEGAEDPDFCKQMSFLTNESFLFSNLEHSPLFQQVLTNDVGQVYMPISITRKLPGTVIIEFVREDPLYRLFIEDEVFIVNSMDILVPDSEQFSLVDVVLSKDYLQYLNNGKINGELSRKISELVNQLLFREIKVKRIEFNLEESLIVTDLANFLFSDDDDYFSLAVRVGYILNDLATVQAAVPDDSSVSLIDMRYDLPIVRLDKR